MVGRRRCTGRRSLRVLRTTDGYRAGSSTLPVGISRSYLVAVAGSPLKTSAHGAELLCARTRRFDRSAGAASSWNHLTLGGRVRLPRGPLLTQPSETVIGPSSR
jgi:hypothetical protein